MRAGQIHALHRFPVKAMAGEALEEAAIGWHGIEGDRRYAFVQSENRSDFPWLTMRQVPALAAYVPRDGAVTTPDGRSLPIESDELRAELAAAHGAPVHLHRDARGLFDAFCVSVMSLQSVRALSALVGRELDPRRFRQTVVVDLPDGEEFPEEAWVGRTIALGDVQVRLDVRDSRCMVVNFDPDTVERDPSVLRTIAQRRGTCFGVYGSVAQPGVARVGDPVSLVA